MAHTRIPSSRLSVFFLTLALAACGGGGGGGTHFAAAPSRLFVADTGNMAIGAFESNYPDAGTAVPDRVLSGSNTGLFNNMGDLFLDTVNNRLYVANGTNILVFNNASGVNSNTAPSRTITSGSFGNISDVHVDVASNILYAMDDLQGIWIFDNASTLNGSVTPDRSLTGDYTMSSFVLGGIFVDTVNDSLYVSRNTSAGPSKDILVFDGASTQDGDEVMPNRIITPTPSVNQGKLFIDPGLDILYLANSGGNAVNVFDNASSLSGPEAPTRTVNLGASIAYVTVNTASNRLYAINPSALYIVDNASTASGSVSARIISAPALSIYTAVAVSN